MISHFNKLGYTPIVGDSFTGDTPLFIKYKKDYDFKKAGWIDIKPVSEIFDEDSSEIDGLGREYDYSEKPYWVLCRSGWCDCKYVYRHGTDKEIYRVTDSNTGAMVDVTEDHSLYNDKQQEIKPSEIDENTKLEYFTGKFDDGIEKAEQYYLDLITKEVAYGLEDRFPTYFMNLEPSYYREILDIWQEYSRDNSEYSKTVQAQIQFFYSKLQ
jgi:hypothetical protein